MEKLLEKHCKLQPGIIIDTGSKTKTLLFINF